MTASRISTISAPTSTCTLAGGTMFLSWYISRLRSYRRSTWWHGNRQACPDDQAQRVSISERKRRRHSARAEFATSAQAESGFGASFPTLCWRHSSTGLVHLPRQAGAAEPEHGRADPHQSRIPVESTVEVRRKSSLVRTLTMHRSTVHTKVASAQRVQRPGWQSERLSRSLECCNRGTKIRTLLRRRVRRRM